MGRDLTILLHLETKDELNLGKRLRRLFRSLVNLKASSSREDNFEDAKKGFEGVVKDIIKDYNGSREKEHKTPDIGQRYKDFMQKDLMTSDSGPDNTGLIYGSEGDYHFNEVPVNDLKLKDIQRGTQGEMWLADLMGRVMSFLKGKPSNMQ